MADNQPEIKISGDDVGGWQASLPTGQVYRGKTQADLLNEVVKGQYNSSLTIQQKEQELGETRRVLEQVTRQQQEYDRQYQEAQRQEGNQFDEAQFNQKFWELINTRPLEAMDYGFRTYFGVQDPRGTFQKSAIVSEFVSDAVATREFLRDNPDFPANAKNSDILVEETLNRGWDLSSFNLEKTWKDLRRENVIAPMSQEDVAREQSQFNTQIEGRGGNTPPPSPDSSQRSDAGTNDADLVSNFAALPDKAAMEAYLRQKGLM